MAHLRHLAIRCHDMEKSRDFYTTVIGWDFLDYRPSRQGLDLTDGVNNITLLQNPPDLVRPSFEEGEEYIHFGVIVDDAAKLWEQLRDAGAEILRDDVKQRNEITTDDAPTGSFKVADPDGNVIDVTDNLREWNYAL